MTIQISTQTINKLGALIGTSNPDAIANLIDRFADNRAFVQALMLDPPTERQVSETVAMFERGEQEINQTGGLDLEKAISNIARVHKLEQ